MRKRHRVGGKGHTVVQGDYEWNSAKAAANLKKHGVSFVEAASALQDPHVVYPPELAHEDRLVAIGHSAAARLLCVVNVDRCERDRIISARLATATEEVIYTEG